MICAVSHSLVTCLKMKLSETLQGQSKVVLIVEALVLVTIIGVLDSISGWDISLFLFYAIPILLVAWFGDRRLAVFCAVACGSAWLWANRNTHPYATTYGYLWAGVNRITYFVLVAFGGAAMKRQREDFRGRMEALDRARELEREIVRVSEHEQMRIGQDLHDGLCQTLLGIDCVAACLKADLEAGLRPEAKTAGIIQELLQEAATEARDLARGIFPVQMDTHGLAAALDDLVTTTNRTSNVTVTFESHGDVAVEEPQQAMHLYRIAQQALNNALSHANAKRITIALDRHAADLIMTISDDGRGLPESQISSRGIGLRTMQYRARLIDAHLFLESAPNGGTRVRCIVPIPPCRERPQPSP